jgi:hypothetical protein
VQIATPSLEISSVKSVPSGSRYGVVGLLTALVVEKPDTCAAVPCPMTVETVEDALESKRKRLPTWSAMKMSPVGATAICARLLKRAVDHVPSE